MTRFLPFLAAFLAFLPCPNDCWAESATSPARSTVTIQDLQREIEELQKSLAQLRLQPAQAEAEPPVTVPQTKSAHRQ